MKKSEGKIKNESVNIVVNSSANEFVGLKIEIKNNQEKLTLCFPIGYNAEEAYNRKEIYNFLNILKRHR